MVFLVWFPSTTWSTSGGRAGLPTQSGRSSYSRCLAGGTWEQILGTHPPLCHQECHISPVSPGVVGAKGLQPLSIPPCLCHSPLRLCSSWCSLRCSYVPSAVSEDMMALSCKNLQSKLQRNKVETESSWLLPACGFPWVLEACSSLFSISSSSPRSGVVVYVQQLSLSLSGLASQILK